MGKSVNGNERFAKWMQDNGLSDSDVAVKMGIDRVYVWRVRTGERAAADGFLWKFAQAYGFAQANELFSPQRSPELV